MPDARSQIPDPRSLLVRIGGVRLGVPPGVLPGVPPGVPPGVWDFGILGNVGNVGDLLDF